MYVRLSVCINSAPTTKICIKYDIGGFRKTVYKILIWLRLDKKNQEIHMKPHKYLYIFGSSSSTKYFVARQQCKLNRSLRFSSFSIVDIYMQTNITVVTHCYLAMALCIV
jgi:hypothetical protein